MAKICLKDWSKRHQIGRIVGKCIEKYSRSEQKTIIRFEKWDGNILVCICGAWRFGRQQSWSFWKLMRHRPFSRKSKQTLCGKTMTLDDSLSRRCKKTTERWRCEPKKLRMRHLKWRKKAFSAPIPSFYPPRTSQKFYSAGKKRKVTHHFCQDPCKKQALMHYFIIIFQHLSRCCS